MFGKKPEKQPETLTIEVSKPQSGGRHKPAQGEVRAQKFLLEDGEGNIRAQLQSAGNGAVALTFHDNDGKMGLLVGLDPNQSPAVALVKEGQVKANVDLNRKTGHPSVKLSGPADSAIKLGFDAKDTAGLELHDQAGRLRVRISLTAQGEAEVALYDTKGYVREKMTQR